MDMTAPALAWCDKPHQVCAVSGAVYIDQLLKICKEERVDLLVPTIDTDLMKLAEAREAFEAIGTRVLIADQDKVALCRDKRLTGAFFDKCGLKAPKTYDNWSEYRGPYPCFIKPKDGSSSINAFRVDTSDQLKAYAARVPDYIVQPFIDGREFTIDIFCDYDGTLLSAIPRERLAVRSGEVLKTRIHMDEKMLLEAKSIADCFRPRGPMTVQLIRDANGDDWFIEINPRYGGGVPLSMKAGARSAEFAISISENRRCTPLEQSQIVPDAIYSRYDQSVCVDTSDSLHDVQGVVFDLDDTLYFERDYVRSGFEALAKYIGEKSAADELWTYFIKGIPAIDKYVEVHDCIHRRNEFLGVYRTHQPLLSLADGVRETLIDFRARGIKLGIITDGRPEGQRAKLSALDLWSLVDDVVITDELGGPQFRKPCDIAFRIMQQRWRIPYEQLVYVGDNSMKDFYAPKQLGMQTVCLSSSKGLHSNHTLDLANKTITNINELL